MTFIMLLNPHGSLLEYILEDSILSGQRIKLKFNNLPKVTQLVSRRAEIETQKYDSTSTCWTTEPTEAVTVGIPERPGGSAQWFQVARCAESTQVYRRGTQR